MFAYTIRMYQYSLVAVLGQRSIYVVHSKTHAL